MKLNGIHGQKVEIQEEVEDKDNKGNTKNKEITTRRRKMRTKV